MNKTLSILVVEDNIMMQETLKELLMGEGYSVSVIECGDELSELGQENMDVVILDVNLPGESGFSLAKRLRTAYPRIGIIMLTARDRPEDSIEGYLNGADNYFSKPFHPQVLLAAIQTLGARVLSSKVISSDQLFQLDTVKKTLSLGSDKISLTVLETIILQNLILATNYTLEDWQLQSLMESELSETVNRHYLQVTISRLRKKIESYFHTEDAIKNIRSIGYRLMIDIKIN